MQLKTTGKVSGEDAKATIEQIIEMIKEVGPDEGILVVVTKGISSPVGRIGVCYQNPPAVAQGLFSQAITFAEFDWIKEVCQVMKNVAYTAQINVDIELARKSREQ